MVYREIIAVCSESHTKHTNTLSGQNVGLLNAKPGFRKADFARRQFYYSEEHYLAECEAVQSDMNLRAFRINVLSAGFSEKTKFLEVYAASYRRSWFLTLTAVSY